MAYKKDTHDETNSMLSKSSSSPPYTIFSRRQKILIVVMASLAATFTALASHIYAPALPFIATDLGVSVELVDLSVTTYLIFQGLAPSLWGPVSDCHGRRLTYILTFLVFLASSIGLAISGNYTALVTLRAVQSIGISSTVSVGYGVIGDITTRKERGGWMGIFQIGLLAPVAFGPTLGGTLSAKWGWQSVFWFLAAYTGAFLPIFVLIFPETLRALVGNGSKRSRQLLIRYPLELYQKKKLSGFYRFDEDETASMRGGIDFIAPLRILCSKQAAPIVLYLAVNYTTWQGTFTACPTLFQQHRGLDEIQIGLVFIANGVGSIIGAVTIGNILNLEFEKAKKNHVAEGNHSEDLDLDKNQSSFPLEKARLKLVPFFCIVQGLSLLLFGWSVERNHIHIALPITATFFIGLSAISSQAVVSTYMVDVFPDHRASAAASLNSRCLVAAAGTALIMPMIHRIGTDVTFTIWAAVQIATLGLLAIQWKFGGKWRMEAETHKKLLKDADVLEST